MGPYTTNPINSPLSNPLGGPPEGSSSGRWVWMQLEGSQLHTLLSYQTELSTIVIVLVQVTRHAPICMQQLDMWEVLLEFSPDVDLNQVCESLMDTKYWMEISCHIRCEVLDAEGLCAARTRLWIPPPQDAKWINSNDKWTLPPLSHVGSFICMMEIPIAILHYQASPTLSTPQLHRIWVSYINQWLLNMCEASTGASWICLKMGSLVESLLWVRMRSNMTNGFLR